MEFITLLGIFAGTLTATANFPQAIKTIRDNNTQGISLIFYIMLATGVFAWILYGIFINDMPIIIANIITIVPVFAVLILKLRNG